MHLPLMYAKRRGEPSYFPLSAIPIAYMLAISCTVKNFSNYQRKPTVRNELSDKGIGTSYLDNLAYVARSSIASLFSRVGNICRGGWGDLTPAKA